MKLIVISVLNFIPSLGTLLSPPSPRWRFVFAGIIAAVGVAVAASVAVAGVSAMFVWLGITALPIWSSIVAATFIRAICTAVGRGSSMCCSRVGDVAAVASTAVITSDAAAGGTAAAGVIASKVAALSVLLSSPCAEWFPVAIVAKMF